VRGFFKKIFNTRLVQALFAGISMVIKKSGTVPRGKWYQLLPVPHVIEVSLNDGVCFNMFNSRHSLEKILFWKGINGYEPHTIKLISDFSLQSIWFLDIGANSGLFSMAVMAANPSLKVYAFEPMHKFYRLLKANAYLNGYDLNAWQLAVSNQNGTAQFFVPPMNQGNIYSASLKYIHYRGHQLSKPDIVEVSMIKLDDFEPMSELKGRGIVKIDAEGND
jgi:FkbM family methyltransferase